MAFDVLTDALGIRDYKLLTTKKNKTLLTFFITQDEKNIRCSVCKSSDVSIKDSHRRTYHSVPFGDRKTSIVLTYYTVSCSSCNKIQEAEISFAQFGKNYTKAFQKYVLSLSGFVPNTVISDHLNVSQSLIEGLINGSNKAVIMGKKQKPLTKLKENIIYKFSNGDKIIELVLVVNSTTGSIQYVGFSEDEASLESFWKKAAEECTQIKKVKIELPPEKIKPAEKATAQVTHIIEPVHIAYLSEKFAIQSQ
ncbi:MAG: transposase [SAR324 cluster bacterium]|nr:transposase [SAR324 cluster bacterium]